MTDTPQILHDNLRDNLQNAIRAYTEARRVNAPVQAYDYDFRDVSVFLSKGILSMDSDEYPQWVQDSARYSAIMSRAFNDCMGYIAAYNGNFFYQYMLGWPK